MGNYNTSIGYQAGASSYNSNTLFTAVGAYAYGNGEMINSTAIGQSATTTSTNQVIVGYTSVTSIGGQVGWTNFSDGRVKDDVQANVPGLSFISLLKPVTYRFNVDRENQIIGGAGKDLNFSTKYNIEKMTFSGFVAQDVDAAAQSIGYDFSGVDKQGAIWGLRYTDFVPALVKGMQEQQQMIEQLKAENEVMRAQLKEKGNENSQLANRQKDMQVQLAAVTGQLQAIQVLLGKNAIGSNASASTPVLNK